MCMCVEGKLLEIKDYSNFAFAHAEKLKCCVKELAEFHLYLYGFFLFPFSSHVEIIVIKPH